MWETAYDLVSCGSCSVSLENPLAKPFCEAQAHSSMLWSIFLKLFLISHDIQSMEQWTQILVRMRNASNVQTPGPNGWDVRDTPLSRSPGKCGQECSAFCVLLSPRDPFCTAQEKAVIISDLKSPQTVINQPFQMVVCKFIPNIVIPLCYYRRRM